MPLSARQREYYSKISVHLLWIIFIMNDWMGLESSLSPKKEIKKERVVIEERK